MNHQTCQCERPILRERAEQKGVSESFCAPVQAPNRPTCRGKCDREVNER